MTEEKFQKELKEVQLKNKKIEFKNKLKAEKNKYKRKFKLPSTSKLILLGVVVLCLQIIAFCEYIIVTTGDTSSVYALIGVPATLVPTIWGYYSKAKAENTKGGITYDMAMKEFETNDDEISFEISEDAQG